MPVGSYQVGGGQLLITDICYQCILLVLVIDTTVNDDTFFALIAYDVAILLQRVAHDSFNLYHSF